MDDIPLTTLGIILVVFLALSAFFSLVGTHGIHVSSGLLWLVVLMYQVWTKGVTETNRTRLMCLSLFWHFLDIVWICVFTVVYLMGSL